MLTYNYKCSTCSTELEIEQSIKDKPISTCPSCSSETLERVISGGLCVFVDSGPTTLGSQMDRNRKKMGHYEYQEKVHKDTKGVKDMRRKKHESAIKKITGKEVKLPENVDGFCNKETFDKISKMTPEQKQKWIQNG